MQKITAFAETQPLAADFIALMKEAVTDTPTKKVVTYDNNINLAMTGF